MLPALSAGTSPERTWDRQPNAKSGSIWPITCLALTGEGGRGLTAEPGSASMLNRLREPWLLGISGARMLFSPKNV